MCEFNIQEIELFNYRQFEDKKFVLGGIERVGHRKFFIKKA